MADATKKETLTFQSFPAPNAGEAPRATRIARDEHGNSLMVFPRESFKGGYDPIGPIVIRANGGYKCAVERAQYQHLLDTLAKAPKVASKGNDSALYEVEPGLLPSLCKPKEHAR
jgi:hypothetical protein